MSVFVQLARGSSLLIIRRAHTAARRSAATATFPWFAMARNWVTCFAHLMFGASRRSGRYGEVPPATPETAAVTDAGTTARVKTRLLADPAVSGLQIDVDMRDRIVTLTGAVSSDTEKARAVELASKIENVIRVEDRLTVRPRIP